MKKLSVVTYFVIIIAFALISSCSSLKNDNNVELPKFKITIENTDTGIKLTSEEGCSWKELTFSLKDGKPQAIDEYGMTEMNKNTSDKDVNLADFFFTLTKTKDGIVLKGIEGMAWTDLSFFLSKNQKQAIDQKGMTELN